MDAASIIRALRRLENLALEIGWRSGGDGVTLQPQEVQNLLDDIESLSHLETDFAELEQDLVEAESDRDLAQSDAIEAKSHGTYDKARYDKLKEALATLLRAT